MKKKVHILASIVAVLASTTPALAQSFDLSGFSSGPQGTLSNGAPAMSATAAAGAASVMTSGSTGQYGNTTGKSLKGYNDLGSQPMAVTGTQTPKTGYYPLGLNVRPGAHGLAKVFGFGGGSSGIDSLGGYVPTSPLPINLQPAPARTGYYPGGGVGTAANNMGMPPTQDASGLNMPAGSVPQPPSIFPSF